MAVIVTNPNWVQIDGTRIQKGSRDIIPLSNGVRLKSWGNSEHVDILITGTTIDGTSIDSVDELVQFFDSQGFKNGGGSGSGATWGNISGNIDDQADLIELIQQSGQGAKGEYFEVTASGIMGEVITYDTGDTSIQSAVVVPQNQKAEEVGFSGYTVFNGVISIQTVSPNTGDVLVYSYVAASSNVIPVDGVDMNYLNQRLGNQTLWVGTQVQYDDIGDKDENTLYFIKP